MRIGQVLKALGCIGLGLILAEAIKDTYKYFNPSIEAREAFTPSLVEQMNPSTITTEKPVVEPYIVPSMRDFNNLSYCEQLDVIAESSGNIEQFIINSGKVSDYIWAIDAQCRWHLPKIQSLRLMFIYDYHT